MQTQPERLDTAKTLPHGPGRCPLFIGVSGGTCSGKTFLASYLYRILGEERVNIISHDDYYKGWPHLSAEERLRINFDHPDALDTALLVEHLEVLRRGDRVRMPVYDFKNHARAPGSREVVPKPFNIIEGILVFNEAGLREALDLRVYLEVSFDTMLKRRIERDVQERGRTADYVRKQLSSTVYPMHLQFVEPYKRYAHLVLGEDTTLIERASIVINNIMGNVDMSQQETLSIQPGVLWERT